MSKTDLFKKNYAEQFTAFEQGLNGERSTAVHQLRLTAMQKFSELNFPTVKDEEWKYTDITSLLEKQFGRAGESTPISFEQLQPFRFENFDAYTMVFVDGVYESSLSDISGLAGKATLLPLDEAYRQFPELVLEKCAKAGKNESQFFSALNISFLKTGAFLQVNKNVVLDKPVYLLYLNSGSSTAVHPRNIFIAENNSQISIVENYSSLQANTYLNNVVTGVFVGENAKVEHIKIQDESQEAYHIAYTEVFEGRYSNYTSYNVNFGGKAARNNIESHFDSENSEAHLFGLYIAGANQLIDNHTMIDHAKANCQSNELYKGVISGNGRAVFNGKVLVRPDAQKTNAFQSNKNILLSDEAIVDTKPQLEIFADDVKCSHGATVGQLDEISIFYLRSRGFSKELAKSILIFAFADDTVRTIPYPGVVAYLEKRINNKLNSDF